MDNSSPGKRTLRRELAANLEICIFLFLLALAIAIYRQVPGALGIGEIWGASLALGALWIVIFPHYLQRSSASDILGKALFLLVAGGMIIFAEWVRAAFVAIAARVFLEDVLSSGHVAVRVWIWVVGGVIAVAAVIGLFLCKRISVALQNRSTTFVRLCAGVVAVVGVFLVVLSTKAGTELLRHAGDGG